MDGPRRHASIRTEEGRALALWSEAVVGLEGVQAHVVPDPTGNPLNRLQVRIDAQVLGCGAATVVRVLAERDPAIIVRNHEVELGYFQLDPCNMKPGQAEAVGRALCEVLGQPPRLQARPEDSEAPRNGSVSAYLRWGSEG